MVENVYLQKHQMISNQSSSARFYKNIKTAISANLLPGLFLQLFALTIGLSYFYWPASQPVFQFFANLKAEYGSLYAVISTSIFGGLLPFLYLFLSGKIRFMAIQQLLFYVFGSKFKNFQLNVISSKCIQNVPNAQTNKKIFPGSYIQNCQNVQKLKM